MRVFIRISIFFFIVSGIIFGQDVQSVRLTTQTGLKISHVLTVQGDFFNLSNPPPLFSFHSHNQRQFSDEAEIIKFNGHEFILAWGKEIQADIEIAKHSNPGALLYLTSLMNMV